MIKAIGFDCFGVLVGGKFDDLYREAGGNPTRDERYLDAQFDRANIGEISDDELNHTIAAQAGIPFADYEKIRRRHEVPNSNLIAYVQKVLRPTFGVHVISNAARGAVADRLGRHASLFNSVTESATVGAVKPDPTIFRHALQQAQVEPHEMIYTDDSRRYVQAAQSLGMVGIHYTGFPAFKRELTAILGRQ